MGISISRAAGQAGAAAAMDAQRQAANHTESVQAAIETGNGYRGINVGGHRIQTPIPAAKRKNIPVLTTGGTIASVGTAHSYAPELGGQALLQGVDAPHNLRITPVDVYNVDSKDLEEEHWFALRDQVMQQIRAGADGIVITHGSDTMALSQFFLGLVLDRKDPIPPIVFTGAMRPSNVENADGPQNLAHALKLAKLNKTTGVVSVLDSTVHRAPFVEKKHTTDVAAFQPVNDQSVGTLRRGKLTLSGPQIVPARTFDLRGVESLPSVRVIMADSLAPPEQLIEEIRGKSANADAIVYAAIGPGTMSRSVREALQEVARDKPVIVSSTAGNGEVLPAHLMHDDRLICAGKLTPLMASMLAKVALAARRAAEVAGPNEAETLESAFEDYQSPEDTRARLEAKAAEVDSQLSTHASAEAPAAAWNAQVISTSKIRVPLKSRPESVNIGVIACDHDAFGGSVGQPLGRTKPPSNCAIDILRPGYEAGGEGGLLALRRDILEQLRDKDRVVVVHDPASLPASAFLLSLTLGEQMRGKTVIFTGAMKDAEEKDADGPKNLRDALRLAKSGKANGVVCVMNGQVFRPPFVRLAHTTKADALQPVNGGYLGTVSRIEEAEPAPGHTFSLDPDTDRLPAVRTVYAEPTARPAEIIAEIRALGESAKAIVFAGTGNGTIHKDIEQVLQELAGRVYVIRAAQTGNGEVVRNGASKDDEKNFLCAGKLTPEMASVLAKVVMASTPEGQHNGQLKEAMARAFAAYQSSEYRTDYVDYVPGPDGERQDT